MSESQQQPTVLDDPSRIEIANNWEQQQTNPLTWELGSREYGGLIELSLVPLEDDDGYRLLHQRQPTETKPTTITDIIDPTAGELTALIKYTAYRIADVRYNRYPDQPDITKKHFFARDPEPYVKDIASFLINTYDDEYLDMEIPYYLDTDE